MADTTPTIRSNVLMRRVVNPIMVRLGRTTVLTVRGRKSGALLQVPIGAPLEFEGARYLVSGRGNTQWMRNLRAAGCGSLRSKGRVEEFRAVEIVGAERDRIVAAYRDELGKMGDRYFREIPKPSDHPVFRIDPLA